MKNQVLSSIESFNFSRTGFILFALIFILSSCQNTQADKAADAATSAEKPIPETLLLKDFKPVSIYNIQQTEIEKARYPVIDIHSHVYAKNSQEVAEWIGIMDEAGIEKSIILTQAHGARFDSILDMYSAFPERFDVWCGIDYSGYEEAGWAENAIAELERCHALGAAGVGELGDKGKGLFYANPPAFGMHPDDQRMVPIWSKCAELGMPVNLHVADPKWMYLEMDEKNDGLMNAYKWRLDDQEGIVDHAGMIRILENTVKKNPNTTFIACHFANCSFDLAQLAGMLDRYPNLYVDNSARYAETCAIPRSTASFYKKYQDRILYGTDMGRNLEMYRFTFRLLESADEHIYNDYNSYHWPLHGLDLPDEILEKVYRLNALKIL